MNRLIFEPNGWQNTLADGEERYSYQDNIRMDDGDQKTNFTNGTMVVTSHRMIWTNKSILQSDLVLPLHYIIFIEVEAGGGFTKSDKLVLHLTAPPPNPPKGPCPQSPYNSIKLVFKSGGMKNIQSALEQSIQLKKWLMTAPKKGLPVAQRKMRSGIGEIEKSMAQKVKQTDKEISKAFKDLDALMESAKPMVKLANQISRKITEKQGDVSDDETVRFRSSLMSLGISNPVTRENFGSGQTYFTQLAQEILKILENPLKESGGMMTLTDAYVRVNRARGLELISPEDFLGACEQFSNLKKLSKQVVMNTFDTTGVKVLQLESAAVTSEDVLEKTEAAVVDSESLTAEEFARLAGVAVVLAKERLLAAENMGRLCRDDSIEGLRFYPNLFLSS